MDNIEEEIWKDVVGFENYYEVSNYGRVKRKKGFTYYKDGRIAEFSETILKPGKNRKGYYIIYLSVNSKKYTKSIHRLVALAFIDNPNNLPQVNHINCNKLDNKVENLEWMSNLENLRHAFKNNIFKERDLKNSNTGLKVINIKTGEIFNNIRIASETIPYSRNYLQSMLSENKPNKTDLRIYEE